jgi:hypothetical protein
VALPANRRGTALATAFSDNEIEKSSEKVWLRISDDDLNNRQPRKFLFENNLTRRVQQPLIQRGLVNAAEIDVEFKITVIEIGHARIFPDERFALRKACSKRRTTRKENAQRGLDSALI